MDFRVHVLPSYATVRTPVPLIILSFKNSADDESSSFLCQIETVDESNEKALVQPSLRTLREEGRILLIYTHLAFSHTGTFKIMFTLLKITSLGEALDCVPQLYVQCGPLQVADNEAQDLSGYRYTLEEKDVIGRLLNLNPLEMALRNVLWSMSFVGPYDLSP